LDKIQSSEQKSLCEASEAQGLGVEMGVPARFIPVAALLCLFASPAFAQCQLAFNEAPQQAIDYESVLDLSVFEGIDPASEGFPEMATSDLQMLKDYAYSLFATGEFDLQSRIYTYILRHQRDPLVMYNLACSFSRIGQTELALDYLDRAFLYGYSDVAWVEQDPDFDFARDIPRYQEIIDGERERLSAQAESRGTGFFVECPALQPCQVILPEDFDPEESHTLVIGLHGAGDSAGRFARLSASFGENDFIYAAPQAPYAVPGTAGYVWFGADQVEGDEVNTQSLDLVVEYLDNVIEQMKSSYDIDRVYLIGFSQGAAMSYLAGISRPDEIDGIVVFGGWLDPRWFTDEELAAASGLRVFIAHGNEDNFELAQQSLETLAQAGYEVDFNEFPGGHFIHLDTLHEAVEWMRD
jgi:phospholipase/carboxylesterase